MDRNCIGDSRMLFNSEKLRSLSGNYFIILLVVISFGLRLYLRSNYLDDYDSVQFIMGLKDYSIVNHQPHPPGYPVYIFLGRITDLFFNDGLESFTFMSALFGSLALIPTYLLAKDLFGLRVGILSSIILSLAPAEMLFSVVVMSDIVSMFFIAATVYLLYSGLNSSKCLYLGSFILGVTMGVRQTDILLIFIFIIILFYKKSQKEFLTSLILLSLGVTLWLVPVIVDTGVSNFIYAQSTQGKAASDMGTLNSLGGLNLSSLIVTVKALISLLKIGWSNSIIPFSLIAIGALIYRIKDSKKLLTEKWQVILLGWMIPYFLLFIFVTYLEFPRYLLPIFPPMAIIFGYSSIRLIDKINIKCIKEVLAIIIILIIISMAAYSISGAYELHKSVPAPVSAANLIKESYNPDATIILAYESFRHFQYYLPEFLVEFEPSSKPREIIGYLAENKTIIIEAAPLLNNIYKSYTFYRDPKIYSKHTRVVLYELNNSLKNVFILDGWYGYENWNNISTCWMSNNATIFITSPEKCTGLLSLNALSVYGNRTLEIYSGGNLVKRFSVPPSFLNASAPITLEDGLNILRLYVPEGCDRPSDKEELNNPDPRCLSIAVQNITIT